MVRMEERWKLSNRYLQYFLSREGDSAKVVAIDGKSRRRAYDKGRSHMPPIDKFRHGARRLTRMAMAVSNFDAPSLFRQRTLASGVNFPGLLLWPASMTGGRLMASRRITCELSYLR